MICHLIARKHRSNKFFTSLFLMMFCLVFGTGEALHRVYHAFIAPEDSPRVAFDSENSCRPSHAENCWTTLKEQAGLRDSKPDAPCFIGQLFSKTLTAELVYTDDSSLLIPALEAELTVTLHSPARPNLGIWLSDAPRGPPAHKS